MKEIEILRSQRFIVWAAMFTVIFLAPNTYFVFYTFSVFISPWREIASGGVALIIASAIMIYTIRKNKAVAMNFALFEVMVAAYYYISTIGLDWALIPALGFAVILPYSVSKYTNEIDVIIDAPESLADLRQNYDKAVNKFMDRNPNKKPSSYEKNI